MSATPPPLPSPRPVVITVLCVLAFIGAALVIPAALLPVSRGIAPWYPPYLVLSGAIGLVCAIGFWKMKRWAFLAYVAFFVINQVIMLLTGIWSPRAAILPLVFIIIVGCYFKRMT